jgi:hypothetical protein
MVMLQSQIDSLTIVTFQNRKKLDLLSAKTDVLCLFLEKVCCFHGLRLEIGQTGSCLWQCPF